MRITNSIWVPECRADKRQTLPLISPPLSTRASWVFRPTYHQFATFPGLRIYRSSCLDCYLSHELLRDYCTHFAPQQPPLRARISTPNLVRHPGRALPCLALPDAPLTRIAECTRCRRRLLSQTQRRPPRVQKVRSLAVPCHYCPVIGHAYRVVARVLEEASIRCCWPAWHRPSLLHARTRSRSNLRLACKSRITCIAFGLRPLRRVATTRTLQLFARARNSV